MRIDLELKRSLDFEALDKGHHFNIHRVYARVRFFEGKVWGEEKLAIVDTGSPYSVLPFHFWQNIQKKLLFQTKIHGIVPSPDAHLKATLSLVEGVFVDNRSVSKRFKFPALLADSPHVPIILGFAHLLEEVKLLINFPDSKAHLEF